MIKKGYKYKVKNAKSGVSKAGNHWCRFFISEKVTDRTRTMWVNWQVMVMDEIDIRDDDEIILEEIINISSEIRVNNKGETVPMHTLWCKVKLILPEPEAIDYTGDPLDIDATTPFDI